MSASNRKLTAEEQVELDVWLDLKQIQLNHRTRRYLSDVVHIAQLYKNVLGKFVDLRNYTSHGNFDLKLINWESFNLKVLRRTGIILRRTSLVQLALGEINALRYILFHLMRLEKNGINENVDTAGLLSPTRARSQPDPVRQQLSARSQPDPVRYQQSGSKNAGKAHSEYSDDSLVLSNTRANCGDLNTSTMQRNSDDSATIKRLNQKIEYFQNALREKDNRIEQLLTHLSKLTEHIMSIEMARKDYQEPYTEQQQGDKLQ